ncbi:hypothetical protein MRX96_004038 [Rhipicephalus microplus]
MDPERDAGRRAARAAALASQHPRDEGAVYVDAARYPGRRNAFAAVVFSATTGKLLTASTVRARTAGQAEEAAIALATDLLCLILYLVLFLRKEHRDIGIVHREEYEEERDLGACWFVVAVLPLDN